MELDGIKQMCFTVGAQLGKGYAECIYQEAICVLLRKNGINYSKEVILPVLFDNLCIGNVRSDIVLNSHSIIIECKAIDGSLKTGHLPQLITYLQITNFNFGVFVNFNQNPLKDMVEIIILRRNNDNTFVAEMLDGETLLLTDKGIVIK